MKTANRPLVETSGHCTFPTPVGRTRCSLPSAFITKSFGAPSRALWKTTLAGGPPPYATRSALGAGAVGCSVHAAKTRQKRLATRRIIRYLRSGAKADRDSVQRSGL